MDSSQRDGVAGNSTVGKSDDRIIEVEGVQYVVVWDGARTSPWGGFSKGELMPPYRHRKHLTVESKVG